jgi:hypothetical protein
MRWNQFPITHLVAHLHFLANSPAKYKMQKSYQASAQGHDHRETRKHRKRSTNR